MVFTFNLIYQKIVTIIIIEFVAKTGILRRPRQRIYFYRLKFYRLLGWHSTAATYRSNSIRKTNEKHNHSLFLFFSYLSLSMVAFRTYLLCTLKLTMLSKLIQRWKQLKVLKIYHIDIRLIFMNFLIKSKYHFFVSFSLCFRGAKNYPDHSCDEC